MRVVINGSTLKRMNDIVVENIALKKQLNDIKLEKVAKEVAKHLDDWLSESPGEKTAEQNRLEFSRKITRYLDHRLKD